MFCSHKSPYNIQKTFKIYGKDCGINFNSNEMGGLELDFNGGPDFAKKASELIPRMILILHNNQIE